MYNKPENNYKNTYNYFRKCTCCYYISYFITKDTQYISQDSIIEFL